MKTVVMFFVLACVASAQSFSLAVEDTMLIASPTVQDVIAAATLTNTSNRTIGIMAKRLANVADTSWNTALCMAICMGPTFDTAGAYEIPPGATQLFLLHYTPSATPSANSVKMQWYEVGDTTQARTQWFHLSTAAPSQFTWPARGQVITFGEPDTIRWTSPLNENAELALSSDAGETWSELSPSVPMSAGMFVWTPPTRFLNIAKLRLRTSTGSVISDLTKLTARFFSPALGDTVHSGSPVQVRWTPGVSGTAEFGYQVGSSSWTKVTSAVSMTSGKYSWTPSASLIGKTVKVRLKTADWTFVSDPFSVDGQSAVDESTPATFAINASPNPARDAITFSTSVSEIRQIDIVDVLGRTVESVSNQSHQSSSVVDLAHLPAGQYIGRIAIAGQTKAIPFSIVR